MLYWLNDLKANQILGKGLAQGMTTLVCSGGSHVISDYALRFITHHLYHFGVMFGGHTCH